MTGTSRPQGGFHGASIILPVINETYSLEQTVEIIEATCDPATVHEYIIVVCDRTTPDSLATCRAIRERLPSRCRVHSQRLPFIGGAMQEAFDLAEGSHVVMMSTDLETDPALVQGFLTLSKAHPRAIITASRWIQGGGFQGYNRAKLWANYLFQKCLSALFWTKLTDLTYAFRLFPVPLVRAIVWEELKHPFFLETIIKPLRLGVDCIEVPAFWKARTEGESQNSFFANFVYFRIALRVRFQSRHRFLRPGVTLAS